MNIYQERSNALTGSACQKKACELFYITHPLANNAVLGPFFTLADAECACRLMHDPQASVTSVLIDKISGTAAWQAQNNGLVIRALAASVRGVQ